MTAFLGKNLAALKQRHYLRKASAWNYWFDFTESRVRRLQRRRGDDFCLVVYRSLTEDDAYVIPWDVARDYFSAENLDDRRRWVGTIIEGELKLGKAAGSLAVRRFHNRFDLL